MLKGNHSLRLSHDTPAFYIMQDSLSMELCLKNSIRDRQGTSRTSQQVCLLTGIILYQQA